jgi:hemerythrin-like domain-containing protein
MRSSRGAPRARTVSACLEHDHRELDAMLNGVESLVRAHDFPAAQRVFADFERRLDGHISAEEEILFPIYEQLSASDGPTNVMLGEHADIRRSMASVAASLRQSNASGSSEAILRLARLLGVHNVKEERVLYPGTDAALEVDAEREALVARIEEHLERAGASR